jgi:hypothetical protein
LATLRGHQIATDIAAQAHSDFSDAVKKEPGSCPKADDTHSAM